MSQSGIDPFNRIDGYTSAPRTTPRMERGSVLKPYVQETVVVENLTTTAIATYSGMGIRTILPSFNQRPENVVRIELKLVVPKSTTIDFLALDTLMHRLSKDQRDQILDFYGALDKDDYFIQNSVTLHLHWDIPMELLRRSPYGVLVEGINQVVQIYDRDADPTDLYPATYQPPPLAIEPTEGLLGTFNKHDRAVKGIWVNIKGTTPIKICNNLNDVTKPEGFSVLMNEEWQHLSIDELAFHGFYLTPMQATAAHTNTTAEQTTAHKQFIADQDKQFDRDEKRADKEYDRNEKKANQEYERSFKEDDRAEKRSDKAYDREQTLIDKTPVRRNAEWQSKAAPVILAFSVVSVVIKGVIEIKKFIDTLVEEK
uniref:Virion structural protein n=1 Tax=Pseudomonas phage RVTF4 TaxID=3236931 RepID=A0AB39CD95_9VIRU